MAIDLEGVDRDACDADAQGKRKEFHAQLKAETYVNYKERIESLVVYDSEGKA